MHGGCSQGNPLTAFRVALDCFLLFLLFSTYCFFFIFFIHSSILEGLLCASEGDTKVNHVGSPFKQLLLSFPLGTLAGDPGCPVCSGLGAGGAAVRRTWEFQF